jgi:type VI secretion system protein ImpK
MRDDIADVVHPVFMYGLRLKERLERGERPDLSAEQAALKGLLGSQHERQRLPEFSGDQVESSVVGLTRSGESSARRDEAFLGVRHALVCWLDEMFILDSPWASEWNEQKLEEALYGSNDRAWKFWEQARKAEARPGTDALEVYYLSVVLGFRGDLRNAPERLKSWRDTVESRIAKGQGREWQGPPEREPPINVPPLHGRERLQRMMIAAWAVLGVLIMAGSFFLLKPK